MSDLDQRHVVVALSGGVDSSVAAARLLDEGWRVSGMTLRLWKGRQQTEQPDEVQNVADRLGIPLEVVDSSQAFRSQVVQPFLDCLVGGETPNPCISCNPGFKWRLLLECAQRMGAGAVATGHYARLRPSAVGGVELLKGVDAHKDQSYFLCMLNQAQLKRTLFPLGTLTKPETRTEAARRGLPTAEKSESQDLCFLSGMDAWEFLEVYAPHSLNPGAITDRQGRVLGEHRGLAFYTIGQRRGLPAAAHALYVLEKDVRHNRLVVGFAEELGRSELEAAGVNWISGMAPQLPVRVEVKIRYKAPPAPALLLPAAPGRVSVLFDAPLRDITPGQAAAFYHSELLLGGGIII